LQKKSQKEQFTWKNKTQSSRTGSEKWLEFVKWSLAAKIYSWTKLQKSLVF
jgi:hypothetical protein